MHLTSFSRDTLEVTWEQCLLVTTKDYVLRDDEPIAELETAYATYTPVTPLEEVPEKLRDFAMVLWTAEIIEEYEHRHPPEPVVEEHEHPHEPAEGEHEHDSADEDPPAEPA